MENLKSYLDAAKVKELLKKFEEDEKNKKIVVGVLAVIGAIAAAAAIAYAVYRFVARDYLENFEDDFEEDFDSDFFDEEEEEETVAGEKAEVVEEDAFEEE